MDPESILHFYRECLALRKSEDVLLYGDYREHMRFSRKIYMYERSWKGRNILVICSFSPHEVRVRLPHAYGKENVYVRRLLGNYREETSGDRKTYESQTSCGRKSNEIRFSGDSEAGGNQSLGDGIISEPKSLGDGEPGAVRKERLLLRPYEALVPEMHKDACSPDACNILPSRTDKV